MSADTKDNNELPQRRIYGKNRTVGKSLNTFRHVLPHGCLSYTILHVLSVIIFVYDILKEHI